MRMLYLNAALDPDHFHQGLACFNITRLAAGKPSSGWQHDLQHEMSWRTREGYYLEALRWQVEPLLLGHAGNTAHFVSWFESLVENGPGQHHPLFDWLTTGASLADMRWFLTQEAAGEAGFDDLVACVQVKLPVQAKLECARNYWDEMGHGKKNAMHGQMLDRMVHALELKPAIETTVWESQDVFGEELEQPLYAHVDRIAAVGLVATRHKSVS